MYSKVNYAYKCQLTPLLVFLLKISDLETGWLFFILRLESEALCLIL